MLAFITVIIHILRQNCNNIENLCPAVSSDFSLFAGSRDVAGVLSLGGSCRLPGICPVRKIPLPSPIRKNYHQETHFRPSFCDFDEFEQINQ